MGEPGRTISASKADYHFTGTMEYEGAGRHVAGVGDVNGDGTPDIMVGAPIEFDYLHHSTGRAYLLLTP